LFGSHEKNYINEVTKTLKNRFDRLVSDIEENMVLGKLEEARDLFEEIIVVYKGLRMHLNYNEKILLHGKVIKLRNKLRMKRVRKRITDLFRIFKNRKI